MKKLIPAILLLTLLSNCYSPQPKTIKKNDRLALPEPDKDLRLKYEAVQKLKNSGCNFSDPDTSLFGISLRNAESATKVIGADNKMEGIGIYHFYSLSEGETLTLTQHPGDGKNQISIFKVEYSDKASYGYKQLNTDTFKTEKGIKLGLTKQQIIERLGNCYAPIDSMESYIELYYTIQLPKDSKSNLLQTNNMPVYYASYKLCRDQLTVFEFGFEYP